MASVITVHGTNSSGPEVGEQWWQRGSLFERELRAYVAADDGELEFIPFIWDGKNSESSRRRAGYRLDQLLRQRKGENGTACVGHSHGGSVLLVALMRAGLRCAFRARRPLVPAHGDHPFQGMATSGARGVRGHR